MIQNTAQTRASVSNFGVVVRDWEAKRCWHAFEPVRDRRYSLQFDCRMGSAVTHSPMHSKNNEIKNKDPTQVQHLGKGPAQGRMVHQCKPVDRLTPPIRFLFFVVCLKCRV